MSHAHGSDLHGRRGRVPRRGPSVAGGERADEPLPSFDTEAGFELHRQWERKLYEGRWSAVSWPEEYGGRGADYIHWLIFEEEYYARRRAGTGQPERRLPARAHDHGGRHRRAEGALPAEDRHERGASGRRPGASPTPAATSRRSAATASPRRRRLGAQRPEDLGVAARCGPTGASASSAPIPRPSATAGSRSSSCRSTTPGITVRPIAQLDGDTGFAEIFFDDVRVPVANTLGEVEPGLERRHGDGRLRARRQPAQSRRGSAPPPTASSSSGATTPTPTDDALRDAVVDAWMEAEGYRLHTYMTVTHLLEGGTIGAGGEPQQDLLERDGRAHARARAGHPRPRRGAHGAALRTVGRRLPVLAVRPDLRGHQRDPAQHHRRPRPAAAAGAADEILVHRRPAAVRRGPARPAGQGVHARATSARRGTTAPATTPRCGTPRRRWACSAMLVPEADGGLGGNEVDLVLLLEELGRAARAGPGHRARRRGRAAAGTTCAGAADGRRSPRRARRVAVRAHAQVADIVLVPGAMRDFAATLTDVDGLDGGRRLFTDRRRHRSRPSGFDAGARRSTGARWRPPRSSSGSASACSTSPPTTRASGEQFGKPIGSFQAVKHLLADALLKVEFAKPAVYRGGLVDRDRRPDAQPGRLDGEGLRRATPPTGPAGLRSRCTAPSATRGRPTSSCWMKKAWALQRAWGDATFHRRRSPTPSGDVRLFHSAPPASLHMSGLPTHVRGSGGRSR